MRSTQIEDAMSVSEEIQAFPAPAKLNLDLRIPAVGVMVIIIWKVFSV